MPLGALSPEMVALIAAGEVIERPASVVKELVENSLDAGASRITVEVQGGGVALVRVSDNGCGIPAAGTSLVFSPHVTSKLTTPEELQAIATLGFRGEALHSIAAVAEVSLLTCSSEDPWGTFVQVRDGATAREEQRGCPLGTTVSVRNLFRKVPARLKFLKSSAAETARIETLMQHFSLAFPGVALSLIADGRQAFASPGTGDLREVLGRVLGAETARSLLEVQFEDPMLPLQIAGFVSPAAVTRSNRVHQGFFVNRRWVYHRGLSAALESAYEGLLMVGRYPVAALSLSLPSAEVDCNVHPAKREVRFRREREVLAVLHKAVRETVIRQSPLPSVKFASSSESQVAAPAPPRVPAGGPPSPGGLGIAVSIQSPSSGPEASLLPKAALPALRVLGQVAGTYIVSEGPDGMYLIDQHAAHERVLFEQVQNAAQRGTAEVQGLLEPVVLELTPAQEGLLREYGGSLASYGFDLETFGAGSCLMRGVPSMLGEEDPAKALRDILGFLANDDLFNERDAKVAHSLACHSAVRAGHVLSLAEMEALTRALEHAAVPHACPHGRPTMIHLSASQLERQFGRR